MKVHPAVLAQAQALGRRAVTPQPAIRFANGTITAVAPGASRDSVAQATVTVNGDVLIAPYFASYTPVVGHLVSVRFINGSPLIEGRVVGLPTF